jgi:hypothetical protein
MRRDPATGAALPALSGREIVARVPGLRREAQLRLEDLSDPEELRRIFAT